MRLSLVAIVCLLGGVVGHSSSVGSATMGGISGLADKLAGFHLGPFLRDDDDDAASAQSDKDPSDKDLSDKAILEEAPVETTGSAGYRIVLSTIKSELRQGRPTYALRVLEKDQMAKKLKDTEYDRLRAVIARSYLSEGVLDKAVGLSEKAIARSGKMVPLAGWVIGQATWRNGDYKRAKDMFALAARSPASSDWLKSSSAFWAARAAKRSGALSEAQGWLEKAASQPRTFYGLIARRALDRDYGFNWSEPSLVVAQKKKLDTDTDIQDALRLSGDGNISAAVDRLGRSGWMRDRGHREQLLAYVLAKKHPALALHVARQTKDAKGQFYDAALYPISPWEPQSGYEVDKALVLALVRQESRFNPHAVSSTGAMGLMQLLPSTARFMSDGNTETLSKPDVNLALGQKYVRHLLKDPSVNNDLFKMAAAYNAGPGNLARWLDDISDSADDPLLFVESIPAAETRAFVERVMVNYWIYSIRMGKDVPSLDAVASGDQAVYADAGRRHAVSFQMASSN